jgi:Bax protein
MLALVLATAPVRAGEEVAAAAATPIAKGSTLILTVPESDKLAALFRRMDYAFADILRGGRPVPRVFLAALPEDLDTIATSGERKALFFKSLLPLVLATNERILADRERLLGLARWLARGHQITAADRDWLAMLAARYEAPAGDLAELARRVDAVPPSMALAQAAVESGWGTSRVAREHNAPFGQIALGPAADGEGGSADDVRYASFQTLAEAVDAYVRNLNTHAAYEDFRLSRADARAAGQPLDGSALMGHLVGYSELGEAYVAFIREVIEANDLALLDGAALAPDRSILTWLNRI